MNIQSMVSISQLIQKSSIILPDEVISKSIELSNPQAIRDDDFIINYDPTKNTLELRFMEHDSTYWDYWSEQDVGEHLDRRHNNIGHQIALLNESKSLYFWVATYEHGLVMHYLVDSNDAIKTCGWDTGITGIFVPSEAFIKECENDSVIVRQRLDSYFEEYSNYCNGEVYTLCRDTYQISDNNYLLIADSEACGGFIGSENAKESLSTFDY